jgi:hypothetical protein
MLTLSGNRVSRWEPILSPDGKLYCSPACGARCKKDDYDAAVKRADDLVKALGPGWKPRVWENMGVVAEHGQFQAWIGIEGPNRHTVQFIRTADDPNDALGIATQDARTFISRLQAALDGLYEGERAP